MIDSNSRSKDQKAECDLTAVHPALQRRTCYHRYEVEPGLYTPGTFLEIDPKRCLDEIGMAADLKGARVLEIGAWDGPFTFEMERRGGEVTAVDIQDPDVTVFNAVKSILGSSARYLRASVYDLKPEDIGEFDLVLFAGVYYHLKNPVLAFHRLRRLLRSNGRIYVEGASCSDYLARRLAKTTGRGSLGSLTELVDQLPIAFFDVGDEIYGHWSNWWFPSTRCLHDTLIDAGFKDVDLQLTRNAFTNYTHRRLMGRAVADPARPDPEAQRLEHEVYDKDYSWTQLQKYAARQSSLRPPTLRNRFKRAVRRLLKRLGLPLN